MSITWRVFGRHEHTSEYSEEVALFGKKSRHAEYCNRLLDISSGLVKALPPIAITNLAVFMALSRWLAKSSETDTDLAILRETSEITLWLFLAAIGIVTLVIIFTPYALVTNKSEAEWSGIRLGAIKRDTASALGDYRGDMPKIQLHALRTAALNDSGKMDRQWLRVNWRTHSSIHPKKRRNIQDLYPNLVKNMDNLVTRMTEYADGFDEYSALFLKEYGSKWPVNDNPKIQYVDNHAKGKIIGSYLWYSGEVRTLQDFTRNNVEIVNDDVTKRFLERFLSGDSSDQSNPSSLRDNKQLTAKAQAVRKLWQSAYDEYMEILATTEEITQRGL